MERRGGGGRGGGRGEGERRGEGGEEGGGGEDGVEFQRVHLSPWEFSNHQNSFIPPYLLYANLLNPNIL